MFKRLINYIKYKFRKKEKIKIYTIDIIPFPSTKINFNTNNKE